MAIYQVFSDLNGKIRESKKHLLIGYSGRKLKIISKRELIRLPRGSTLFYLPGRLPIGFNIRRKKYEIIGSRGSSCAVAAFLPQGYLRLYLPAYLLQKNSPILPIWAYCAVGYSSGKFFASAVKIEKDIRYDPKYHRDIKRLKNNILNLLKIFNSNRLINHLKKCALDYNCYVARNFFMHRWEMPVPTSKYCNNKCIACISESHIENICSPQSRLDFTPTPDEIIELIGFHTKGAPYPIISFGQGCEGEPLIEWELIEEILKFCVSKYKATYHINTNGSNPVAIRRLALAGMDSFRFSIFSFREYFWEKYHNPDGYDFKTFLASIETAIKLKKYVSLNWLVLPGFTDQKGEIEALIKFYKKYPFNMIQLRNLNIDPDYIDKKLKLFEEESLGMLELLKIIKKRLPDVRIGYVNPPKEGFENRNFYISTR